MEEPKRVSFKYDKDGKVVSTPDPNGKFIMSFNPCDSDKSKDEPLFGLFKQRRDIPFPELLDELTEVSKYYGSNLLKEPLFKATIPNFTNTIIISDRMRLKPYLEGRKTPKIPAKYKNGFYGYNAAGKLCEIATGKVIASNPTKCGTPRLWNVNFQDIYDGKIKEHARADYIKKLHKFIVPYFEEHPLITENNLRCELRFYLLDKTKSNIDIDNISGIWFKAILDVAKSHVLTDDNNYVISALSSSVTFVKEESATKLEIILWAKD